MWHIDLETRSLVDLLKYGSAVYAAHPSTKVLCMGYGQRGRAVDVWKPGDEFPQELLCAVENGEDICGWNLEFEFWIWNMVFRRDYPQLPKLRVDQLNDTMTCALASGFPGKLERACEAARLPAHLLKDTKGHAVMLRVSKPRGFNEDMSPIWWEDPERLQIVYDYCGQDVVAEMALAEAVRPLTKRERELYKINFKINLRGITVDRPAVKTARQIVHNLRKRGNKRLSTITGGLVKSTKQTAQLLSWLNNSMPYGEQLPNLQASTIEQALENPWLPEHIRTVLELRQLGGKAATAKLDRMLATSKYKGRIFNSFMMNGAGQTGRFAGRGVQLQNMLRSKLKENQINEIANALSTMGAHRAEQFIRDGYGEPNKIIGQMVRPFLMARENHVLITADYSNIEGRFAAWIAGEDWKIKAYREYDSGKGLDLYKILYGRTFNVDPAGVGDESTERQIGKVMELFLQYEGGFGAFKTGAKTYGFIVTEKNELPPENADKPVISYDEAERLKWSWRDNNPAIKRGWQLLKRAAIAAMQKPGRTFSVFDGKVKYKKEDKWLLCQLPSRRIICYAYPHLKQRRNPWTGKPEDVLCYWKYNSMRSAWEVTETYGGKQFENIVQAAARCKFTDAFFECHEKGIPLVLHTHDELVAEVHERDAEQAASIFRRCLEAKRPWCADVPIVAKPKISKRYSK